MEQLSGDVALPVDDLFSYLQGNWNLSRTINDLYQNMSGVMSGRVELVKRTDIDGNPSLAYREEGELRFGDYQETVFRFYDFSFPSKRKAVVHFTDGRIFHELDLSTGFWEPEHLCEKDMYRGRFRIESRDTWQSNWFISGPTKELVLDNFYQRQS